MRSLFLRWPLISSLVLAVVLWGLMLLSRAPFPESIVGDVGELSPEKIREPTALEEAVSSLITAENLYLLLALALAVILVTLMGWWREVGFNRPASGRSLLLLWFPILVIALTLSGGVRLSGPFFLSAILVAVALESVGSEMIFRGVIWRALAPTGLFRAVIFTSLASGLLTLFRTLSSGPWPEAIYLTLTATCGGFTYAAIRWRTASIWPVIAIHFALALSIDVAMVRGSTFPYLLFATTFGFIGYGLFLLRNRRVREDGGMSVQGVQQTTQLR